MDRALELVLLVLQAFLVAFMWAHDWVPLGTLNDIPAVRRRGSTQRRVAITLLQSISFTIGLALSAAYFGHVYPFWIREWLWVSYVALFVAHSHAWWGPYLWSDPRRAARYEVMFGSTHSFLPARHGMVPNTLHTLVHAATFATLVVLVASRVLV